MAGASDTATGVAGLTFTDLTIPGIRRERTDAGWRFRDPAGRAIRDTAEQARLLAIGLPPAYADAWYNPDPAGHIQAIGIDARGRRQYRYHPGFRAHRETAKFDTLPQFGLALPRIRSRVTRDLSRRGACRERVVAAIVRLLDLGRIRIGNERYARENRSFGATTLRMRHVAVKGDRVQLLFRAKHGVQRRLTLGDRSLVRVVKHCQDLPGQHLFCYEDPAGEVRPIGSHDVNAYIREIAGDGLSAKNFRTWWASAIALDAAARGASLADALEEVADMLGNTPAVTRKSYVHPAVIEVLKGDRACPTRGRGPRALSGAERRLLALLDQAARGGEPSRSARRMKLIRPSDSSTATATS